ncbi:MAG: ATP-binding cassette domain-containing protein [Alphaproteobacteria bacterium]|nr:ATP-binding cassette domain-containing protein [Alphaproteobacteria bacterium]
MAPPVLTLRGGMVTFGGMPLFDNAELALAPGARACLVGRNASGKSTLLKILASEITADRGELFVQPGLTVSLLPQSPIYDAGLTVDECVATPKGRPAPASHKVDEILARLELDGRSRFGDLSGGEARRAALATALVGTPDILLLDEPTNHLDLPTIQWLESELAELSAAILMISHDRAFLANMTNETFWLRHDKLLAAGTGYRGFGAWAEKVAQDEAKAAQRLKQKIKAEEHWLIHGVTARRKRNQARLGKLAELRAARGTLLRNLGSVRLTAETGKTSGRLVVDAEELSKSYDGTPIIEDFSTRIIRGDRIGIVGRNGSGKTTLANLLTGRLEPDAGRIRLGSNVAIASLDQNRESLDQQATLWRTLVPGGGDSLDVRGRQRHVVSYLRDFLFDEKQAKMPVKSLSGGEQNRLALAKALARPANFLLLDEPTNDLDMDTLDVLEDMLADFEGTLILVSHDRDFLDRIVTSTIVLEGDGRAVEYAGGYSETLAPHPDRQPPRRKKKVSKSAFQSPRPKKDATKLGHREQRELDTLPQKIAQLEDAKRQLDKALADPGLYDRDRAAYAASAEKLADVETALTRAEARWLDLEERRETLARRTG